MPFAKREGKKLFGNRKWLFQQDGASSHTSNEAQNWCRKNLPEFLEKHNWPPNSPDLSPLDYFYWNEVDKNIKYSPFMTIDMLKEEIKNACSKVNKDMIKNSVQTFTSRVRAVEDSKGVYIEKRKINRN